MSVYAYAAVWSDSTAAGHGQLVIMLALADSADKHTGEAEMSVLQLAGMARMAPSTARAHLRCLEEQGDLVRLDPQIGGRGVMSRWRVNLGPYRQEKPAETRHVSDTDRDEGTNRQVTDPPSDGPSPNPENPPETGVLQVVDTRRDPAPIGRLNPLKRHRKPTGGPAPLVADTDLLTVSVSSSSPPSASSDEEERRRRLATRWAELTGVTLTPAVAATWDSQIRHHLTTLSEPTEWQLTEAARRGIRQPSGWQYTPTGPVDPSTRPVDPTLRAAIDATLDALETEPVEPDPTGLEALGRQATNS